MGTRDSVGARPASRGNPAGHWPCRLSGRPGGTTWWPTSLRAERSPPITSLAGVWLRLTLPLGAAEEATPHTPCDPNPSPPGGGGPLCPTLYPKSGGPGWTFPEAAVPGVWPFWERLGQSET